MKKIISALAIGSVAAGVAFADMKVSLNYRNGVELFKYVNKGYDGRSTDDYGNIYIDSGYDNNGSTTNWFNLTGWNAGKDNLGLTASGDIFTIKTTLQPTTGGNNNIVMHVLDFGAKYGDFYANAGWNGDGAMNFRAKKDADNGNEEGKVFETFKLGSAFTGSDAICVNNQLSFGTGRNFFALAGYNLNLDKLAGVKGLSVKVQGTLISDRTWDSQTATNSGVPGWAVFVMPKMNKIFEAELFAKGIWKDATKEQETIAGLYAKPLVVPMLADSTVGGSVVFLNGKLQEYNFDVRAYIKVNADLTITSFNKFAKLCTSSDTPYEKVDGAAVGALAGLTGFKSSQVLWNMLAARYKVNELVDSKFHLGRNSEDGTQIFVHPHAQIFASSGASVTAGVLVGFGGIGANEMANKDMDILVNIPILFRVKM